MGNKKIRKALKNNKMIKHPVLGVMTWMYNGNEKMARKFLAVLFKAGYYVARNSNKDKHHVRQDPPKGAA